MVRKGHAPQLDVVVERNADFCADLQTTFPLTKLDGSARETNFIALGQMQGRLIRGRPEFSARFVTQINKGSPAIACGVLAPTSDRQVPPTAVAAPGVADRHVIAAVGQEVNLRCARSGGFEDSHLSSLTRSASVVH